MSTPELTDKTRTELQDKLGICNSEIEQIDAELQRIEDKATDLRERKQTLEVERDSIWQLLRSPRTTF